MPFLAIAATFNEQLSIAARWIIENLGIPSMPRGLSSVMFGHHPYWLVEEATRRCHADEGFRVWANSFLRHADVGIQRFDVRLVEPQMVQTMGRQNREDFRDSHPAASDSRQEYQTFFVHSGQGPDGRPAEFDLLDESQGTRQLFDMLVPVYQSLQDGRLLVVDELSGSLHPLMTRELIRIFHDPETNAKNAQLVFATHDASLLDGRIFRRDQVWFTEKDRSGATDLYSLHDFKPKEGGDIAVSEAGYLRGRYGAIPFFTPFNFPPVANGEHVPGSPPTKPESPRTRKGGKKIHPDRHGR